MKFLAVLAESGAADTLSKIAEFISKICTERVTLRITSDLIYLIRASPLAGDGNYLQVTINVREFFSTYIMGGVSEEFNEIYMEVEKNYLYKSMSTKDRSTKIRLVKVDNTPHLKIEQKSCGMVHEVPVELIPVKYWKTYDMPSLNNVQVALYLPPISIIRNLVISFKNMGVKQLSNKLTDTDHLSANQQEMKASQNGELHFCGDLDMAKVAAHFSNLASVPLDNVQVNGADSSDIVSVVRVNIKAVHAFLRSLANDFTMSRLLLKIVPEKMAIFSLTQDDASVLYIISGMVSNTDDIS